MELTRLANAFGDLDDTEVNQAVGDILCLAKIVYETADRKAILNARKQILDLEDAHDKEVVCGIYDQISHLRRTHRGENGYLRKLHYRDATGSRIEEGILIATQDLGYTKKPDKKEKSFKTFAEVGAELSTAPLESVDENTTRDIIAIDMLSRAFLLEDVMNK